MFFCNSSSPWSLQSLLWICQSNSATPCILLLCFSCYLKIQSTQLCEKWSHKVPVSKKELGRKSILQLCALTFCSVYHAVSYVLDILRNLTIWIRWHFYWLVRWSGEDTLINDGIDKFRQNLKRANHRWSTVFRRIFRRLFPKLNAEYGYGFLML